MKGRKEKERAPVRRGSIKVLDLEIPAREVDVLVGIVASSLDTLESDALAANCEGGEGDPKPFPALNWPTIGAAFRTQTTFSWTDSYCQAVWRFIAYGDATALARLVEEAEYTRDFDPNEAAQSSTAALLADSDEEDLMVKPTRLKKTQIKKPAVYPPRRKRPLDLTGRRDPNKLLRPSPPAAAAHNEAFVSTETHEVHGAVPDISPTSSNTNTNPFAYFQASQAAHLVTAESEQQNASDAPTTLFNPGWGRRKVPESVRISKEISAALATKAAATGAVHIPQATETAVEHIECLQQPAVINTYSLDRCSSAGSIVSNTSSTHSHDRPNSTCTRAISEVAPLPQSSTYVERPCSFTSHTGEANRAGASSFTSGTGETNGAGASNFTSHTGEANRGGASSFTSGTCEANRAGPSSFTSDMGDTNRGRANSFTSGTFDTNRAGASNFTSQPGETNRAGASSSTSCNTSSTYTQESLGGLNSRATSTAAPLPQSSTYVERPSSSFTSGTAGHANRGGASSFTSHTGETNRGGPSNFTSHTGDTNRAGPSSFTSGTGEANRAGASNFTSHTGETNRAGASASSFTSHTGETNRGVPSNFTSHTNETNRAGASSFTSGTHETNRAGVSNFTSHTGEANRAGASNFTSHTGETNRSVNAYRAPTPTLTSSAFPAANPMFVPGGGTVNCWPSAASRWNPPAEPPALKLVPESELDESVRLQYKMQHTIKMAKAQEDHASQRHMEERRRSAAAKPSYSGSTQYAEYSRTLPLPSPSAYGERHIMPYPPPQAQRHSIDLHDHLTSKTPTYEQQKQQQAAMRGQHLAHTYSRGALSAPQIAPCFGPGSSFTDTRVSALEPSMSRKGSSDSRGVTADEVAEVASCLLHLR